MYEECKGGGKFEVRKCNSKNYGMFVVRGSLATQVCF